MKTTKIQFFGITETGCGIYASVIVPEDYSMNQLVCAIKAKGFVSFRTNTIRILVDIQ